MKQTLLITLGLALASSSFAQKTIPGSIYLPSEDGENANTMVVPKEFAFNNKPLLSIFNREKSSQISIYDENIDLVKTFDIDDNKTFDYTLVYQNETRDVTSVDEKGVNKTDLNQSYKEWLEREQMVDPSVTEYSFIITKQENGDSIISADYSKISYSYTTNEQMYFGYSIFGLKYPRLYWIASKGNMYQCKTSYTVSYSDWKANGQTEEPSSRPLRHICLYNLNLDNGAGTNNTNGTYFMVSQTLFNQDEDYEYIIPKLALVGDTDEGPDDEVIVNPSNSESIETTRTTLVSEKSNVGIVGFQVVSSNGKIIKDLTFDEGFACKYRGYERFALITMGGNRYLAFSNGSTIFYKIDSQTSAIKKVNVAPGSLFVQPTVVNKNATINVSLGDNNDKASDIVVVSMSGNKVKSVNVPANQSQVQIPINISSGVYCVSRVQQGKVNETKKIIVK